MLEMDSVTKRYDGQLALDNVSVSLARGSVVGLAGENGAGKSTLLNIASGIVQPDTGTMRLDGREIRPGTYKDANELGIWRAFQEPALIGGIPLYENIFLGNESAFTRLGTVSHARMVREAQRIVDEFGIRADVRRQAGEFTYSVRQAIEAVKATAVPDALGLPSAYVLFDEPTAALSQEEVPHLLELIKRLAARGLGVAFVSHRLQEVLSLCDDIVVLKDGAVVSEAKAQSVDEASLHQLMVGRVRHQDFHAEDRQGGVQSERIVLSVRGAGQRDRARSNRVDAQRFLFHDVDFDLRAGEILGVGGLIGSGKTSLARSVAGVEKMNEGHLQFDGLDARRMSLAERKRRGMVYLSPDRHNDSLIQDASVRENIALPSGEHDRYGFVRRGGIWDNRLELSESVKAISRYKIKAKPGMRVAHLSGGNQQKVALAKWTRREPKVLIVENLTAGVDVGAKVEIYHILRDLAEGGTGILLISDDLPELIGLSDRVLIMRSGRAEKTIETPRHNKPEESFLIGLMA